MSEPCGLRSEPHGESNGAFRQTKTPRFGDFLTYLWTLVPGDPARIRMFLQVSSKGARQDS